MRQDWWAWPWKGNFRMILEGRWRAIRYDAVRSSLRQSHEWELVDNLMAETQMLLEIIS
jgi:hypothetical protein